MMEFKKSVGMAVIVVVSFVVLAFIFSGTTWAGSLEPSAPPGPTMKTLDEIPPTWSQILPASTRFVLVMGGAAVLDKETGLVWEKSPSTSTFNWFSAQSHCNNQLTVGNRKGWRLPTDQELGSLVDPSVVPPGPTLPAGHPFINVQSNLYWSATTDARDTSIAWIVDFFGGGVITGVGFGEKANSVFVWCVRGGQGVDPQ